MARIVEEIMNRELLTVRPDFPAEEVRDLLAAFAVGAAPVVDEQRRPVGVVSVRDLLTTNGTALQRMTKPAICIPISTTVEDASRTLARTDMHHLVVVDGAGTAVGMLSSLDLLRALLGMPARHPSTFPHWDPATELTWTDDWNLDDEGAAHAPEGPGILVLIDARVGAPDTVVWAESPTDLRSRTRQLVRDQTKDVTLARVLALRGLRFRAALVQDEAKRERGLAVLRSRLEHVPPPGAT